MEDFPLYTKLPSDLQIKLEGHINIFLSEKKFFGCNEFVITDRVRLLIAAQASLLIINKAIDAYSTFQTILVYPDVYLAPATRQEGAVQSSDLSVRAGESWQRGPVILAWDHVLQGARESRDGHNVVMHEFAHKLDEGNSAMDGLPVLTKGSHYGDWAKILGDEYKKQQQKMADGESDVIDSYGASSPAEFFAVVTEIFFEKPRELKREHPKVFEQFQLYYQLDPTDWKSRS